TLNLARSNGWFEAGTNVVASVSLCLFRGSARVLARDGATALTSARRSCAAVARRVEARRRLHGCPRVRSDRRGRHYRGNAIPRLGIILKRKRPHSAAILSQLFELTL